MEYYTVVKKNEIAMYIDMIALQNILWTEISKAQINMYNKFDVESIHINIFINTWNVSGRLKKKLLRAVDFREGTEKLGNLGRKNNSFALHTILTFWILYHTQVLPSQKKKKRKKENVSLKSSKIIVYIHVYIYKYTHTRLYISLCTQAHNGVGEPLS